MTKKCLITDKITEICVENIKSGMSYSACAKAINVSQQTFCNWQSWGREGRTPYAKWYIAIQEAEAALMKECLDAVKLSMKLGDVKSAYFLLQTRFADQGFARTSQVNMKSQNENLNLSIHATPTFEENEKIRNNILGRLQPKGVYVCHLE